jgi:hypothetical protein
MDDQRTDREGGGSIGRSPSKWWAAVPTLLTAAAVARPTSIIVVAALVAWAYWALIIFRRPYNSPARRESTQLGCMLGGLGALVCLGTVLVGLGHSMAPGGPNDDILIVPFLMGGALVVLGLIAFAISKK